MAAGNEFDVVCGITAGTYGGSPAFGAFEKLDSRHSINKIER